MHNLTFALTSFVNYFKYDKLHFKKSDNLNSVHKNKTEEIISVLLPKNDVCFFRSYPKHLNIIYTGIYYENYKTSS